MAYIQSYTYDIFISYAHLDNITAFHQDRGWIEQFFEDLRVSLAQRIGKLDAIKIWWDNKKLDGSILFDQSIESGIQHSAILLCLLSPGYMASEYCRKELDLFHKKAQQEPAGLKVGDRSRIINVLLYNIPYKEWPDEFSGTTGFPFYQADSEEDWGNPMDIDVPAFRKGIHDLREALVNVIKQMNEVIAPSPPPPPSPQFTIYFGDVADSLRTVRKRTVTELEKEGYHIICDVPPPFEKEDHEKAVADKMAQTALHVHLLDQFPGREIEEEESIWYPQKQVEIGLLSDKPQLIWMPAGTDIEIVEEESYKTFLQELESGQRSPKKIEFIRGSKSELSQQIMALVEQLKKEQEQETTEAVHAAHPAVLLDTHLSDQLYALEVGKSLLENGIQPYINPVEDDPRQNANTWDDRISRVNKLVFFYGKVTWEWVRSRMNAALQNIVTNYYPVEEFIVFMVPPHKNPGDISLRQWVLKVNVVNNSDKLQLDDAALQQFIQSIKKPMHER